MPTILTASPQRMSAILVVLGFVVSGLMVGVVTASGNLMLTGLVMGVVTGLLLMSAVETVVWIVLIGALLISGPMVLFYPQYTRITWAFSILGFFLIFAAIVHAGTSRIQTKRPAPAFLTLAIAFAVLTLALLPIMEGTFVEGAGAVKRNYQYLGLLLAMAFVPMKPKSIRAWINFILIVGLLQLPFALYQRVVLVPLRLNLPNRVVPVDVVAGTFEASLWGGGNSNVMALFILIILAGIICLYREKVLSRGKALLLFMAVGLPLGLGETKLVLVLLPVAFVAIFMDLIRKRPMMFALGSTAMAVAMAGLFYVYVAVQNHDSRSMTFEARVQENLDYNFGELGYYDGPSLNRVTAVKFWWDKNGISDPIHTVFGHGLGASFSMPGSDTFGHLNVRYSGHGIDLTGLSTLLWDVGLFGTLLYFLVLWSAWRAARKLAAEALPGYDRALLVTLSAAIAMIGVMVLATSAMFWAPSMQVIMMTTLGLLAWRWRQSDSFHG